MSSTARSYAHVAAAVFGRPWYMLEETMGVIADIVSRAQVGARFTDDEIRERLDAAAEQQGPRTARPGGVVGVIPVYGSLMQRANLMSDISGGTTYQGIAAAFRQAMADDQVSSILLDVDSPGGEVAGVDDLATEIRNGRGRKPIVAVANSLMASAAYYIAAQADEIVATPSSMIGSIGTVVVLQEASRALDEAGITTTILRRPEGKYRPNSYEPLDDATRAKVQGIVDAGYDLFVKAVAKGRGVSPKEVRAGFGGGDVLFGAAAVEAGLADSVDTFDGVVARLARGGARAPRAQVRADWDEAFLAAEAAADTQAKADAAMAVARARLQEV